MAAEQYPLEPTAEEMRSMGRRALEFLVEFIGELPNAAASDLDGLLELAAGFRDPLPEQGRDFDDLLGRVAEGAAKGFNTTGPGYLAYIPGGGLFAAAVADFLACGVNRFVNVWNAAPAFAQIEATVIRWLCELFGLPEPAGGVLTSGGSMANFSAIVTARRTRLPEDFLGGTLYVSDQVHASVTKSAILAGFPAANVREVRSDATLAIDVSALRAAIERDRAEGLQPFLVVGSAGTTNTGRVDPLEELASVAAEAGLWFHVDAAYGGFFVLTDRGRARFAGIERADSITLDPHKAMFLPYGTGCLLVRDRALLREAHSLHAAYLQDLAPEGEIPNFTDSSPELSRDFRGLRVWLPLQLHGAGAFRAALEEKLDLAEWLFRTLREASGFDLPWEPDLTVVAFRYEPAAGDPEEFNRRLLERINASRRVFLSSTEIGGRFVIRACIVSHRTHRDRIEEAAEIIRSSARDLEREGVVTAPSA
jgi:aromatic-L-amino-acid decarboxylase